MSPYLHAGSSNDLLPGGFLTKILCPFLFSSSYRGSPATLPGLQGLLCMDHNRVWVCWHRTGVFVEESRDNTIFCSNYLFVQWCVAWSAYRDLCTVMCCRDRRIVTCAQLCVALIGVSWLVHSYVLPWSAYRDLSTNVTHQRRKFCDPF